MKMIDQDYINLCAKYLIVLHQNWFPNDTDTKPTSQDLNELVEEIIGSQFTKMADTIVFLANYHFIQRSGLFYPTDNLINIGCGLVDYYNDYFCSSISGSRCSCRNQKDWNYVFHTKDLLSKQFLRLQSATTIDGTVITDKNQLDEIILLSVSTRNIKMNPYLKVRVNSFTPEYYSDDDVYSVIVTGYQADTSNEYVHYGNNVGGTAHSVPEHKYVYSQYMTISENNLFYRMLSDYQTNKSDGCHEFTMIN